MDLIDREQAKEHLIKAYPLLQKEYLNEVINEIPSAGVNGQWIYITTEIAYDKKGDETWGAIYKCNNCGFEHTFIENHTSQYRFCPNCGADMREVE